MSNKARSLAGLEQAVASVGRNNYVPSAPVPFVERDLDTTDMPWKDINYDEKTERTRQMVRVLLREIEVLKAEMRQMKEHTHDKDGDAIISQKISERYPQGTTTPGSYNLPDTDDTYF